MRVVAGNPPYIQGADRHAFPRSVTSWARPDWKYTDS